VKRRRVAQRGEVVDELDEFDEFEESELELGELLDDELFMSVPCEAGELDESLVLELVVPPVLFEVELPMLPLALPLTDPLPVWVESTGPSAPLEPLVPVEVSVPVEGEAGRAWSEPLEEDEPAVSPLEEVEPLTLPLELGVVVLELDELWSWSLERSRGELLSLELPRGGSAELRPCALRWLFE
jgi:hypothetical protein